MTVDPGLADVSRPITSPSPAGPGRAPMLPSLTGLRGPAALVVAVVHGVPLLGGSVADLAPAYEVATHGVVTLFFVLSGFMLTWTARPGERATRFWRRRLARIYPVYALALLLTSRLGSEVVSGEVGRLQALSTVFLVQAWVPDRSYTFALNQVAWSLSCEAFFYLVFPVILPRLVAVPPGRRRRLQVALFAGLVLAAVVGAVTGDQWWVRFLPPVQLLSFTLGATLALDVRDGRAPRLGLVPSAALTVVAMASSALPGLGVLGIAVLPMVPFLLLIAAAARLDLSGRGTVLARRAVVWAGTVSYCFYLFHQPVLHVVAGAWPTASGFGDGVPALLVALVVAAGVALAVHVRVERPLERRLRGRGPGSVTTAALPR